MSATKKLAYHAMNSDAENAFNSEILKDRELRGNPSLLLWQSLVKGGGQAVVYGSRPSCENSPTKKFYCFLFRKTSELYKCGLTESNNISQRCRVFGKSCLRMAPALAQSASSCSVFSLQSLVQLEGNLSSCKILSSNIGDSTFFQRPTPELIAQTPLSWLGVHCAKCRHCAHPVTLVTVTTASWSGTSVLQLLSAPTFRSSTRSCRTCVFDARPLCSTLDHRPAWDVTPIRDAFGWNKGETSPYVSLLTHLSWRWSPMIGFLCTQTDRQTDHRGITAP